LHYTPLAFLNLAYFHLFFKVKKRRFLLATSLALVDMIQLDNKTMGFRKIFSQLNIVSQCRKYKLSLWQCPQFLFLLMGLVIMITAVVTYTLGTRVADSSTVLLIVFSLTIVLFVITFSITRSLEGLAEANRLKSEFISIVSHQLRSPFSNLKWALELLMSGRLGEIKGKQADYMKILKDNTARMGELIADLLIVSRIEQGKYPLQKTEFSLQDLAKKIIAEFEHAAKTSQIEIKLVVSGNLPQALADVSRIKMVAGNFLDNAIRYTKGKGEVDIKIEPKNKSLLFSVQDNGVGIPQKDQKHIFQKFFRSENVLKHQTSGSGLGLYIAKSIIEGSGGKIGFKSKENKGSTFWFTIPTKIH